MRKEAYRDAWLWNVTENVTVSVNAGVRLNPFANAKTSQRKSTVSTLL